MKLIFWFPEVVGYTRHIQDYLFTLNIFSHACKREGEHIRFGHATLQSVMPVNEMQVT